MPLPELSDKQRTWYILQGYKIIEVRDWYNRIDVRTFFKNGKLHREDGPARESKYKNNKTRKRYYLDGELLTEQEFLKNILTL